MSITKSIVLLLLLSFSFSSCHLVKSVIYLRPDHKDNRKFTKNEINGADELYEWEYSENQLDAKEIDIYYKDGKTGNLDSLIETSYTNAFMIIKDDEIIFEEYHNKYHQDRTHGSFSISKGMLATMVGLTLEEGLIESLNDPITKYIPELINNDPDFEKINVGHLFDMKSGIAIRGEDANPFGDLARTYYGNNFIRFMKTIEIDTLPGGAYNYNQTDAQLLSLIITRVTEKSLAEYFNEKVWSKIGAAPAYWNTYRKGKLEKGFCCYNARVQDYAKFAKLYIQNGNWEGEQIIPEDWVAYTTQQEIDTTSKWNFSFNKYWFPASDGKLDYTAQGYNRQFIYINPTENIIILRFGKKEDTKVDWEKMMRVIANQVK